MEQLDDLLGAEKGAGVLARKCGRVPVALNKGVARGFTLIELIVTITLLGILVALSLPSFTGWIRNSQVRTVAEALQTGMRTAQAEAVRRNQEVVMTFTNDPNPQLSPTAVAGGKSWAIQSIPSAFANDGVAEFIRSGVMADVASAVAIADGPATICFNSNGRLTTSTVVATCAASTATFNVKQPPGADRPLRVVVQVGGQVRMCDPARVISSNVPDGCS